MVKEIRDLVKPELSNYEKAKAIVRLPFYVGGLEAWDLCRLYNSEQLNNMYIIGNILKKYPYMLDY